MQTIAEQLREQFPARLQVELVGEGLVDFPESGEPTFITPGTRGVVVDTDANVYDDGGPESGPHLVVDLSVQVLFDAPDQGPWFCGPDELRIVEAAS